MANVAKHTAKAAAIFVLAFVFLFLSIVCPVPLKTPLLSFITFPNVRKMPKVLPRRCTYEHYM